MMLRVFNAILVVAVLISAFVLYSLEHAIRGEERAIAKLESQIANERETIALLDAEWSNLTRPERLQMLAEKNLGLKPVSPDQYVSASELKARVPAEPIVKLEEKGKDTIGDILKAMEKQ
jgi:cell division protein FtsL